MPKPPIKPAVFPVPRMRSLRSDEPPAQAVKPAHAPAARNQRARRRKFVF